jgi:hypothetical protein
MALVKVPGWLVVATWSGLKKSPPEYACTDVVAPSRLFPFFLGLPLANSTVCVGSLWKSSVRILFSSSRCISLAHISSLLF